MKCAHVPWASYNTPWIELIQYGCRIGKKVYSSPHSWMFTSVSVGSNPRSYLFATATVRMGVYTALKYITKAIQHLSHWSLFTFTFTTQKYGLQSLMNWRCWNKCLHSINWTFNKAWVSHTNAFSTQNMQLKWRRFRMTSFLEKHWEKYYFKSQQNFAGKFF